MHCLEIGTSSYPLPFISRRLRYMHCLKVSFVFPFIYALLPRRWMPTWHSCYPHLNTRRLFYKTASVGIIGKQNSSSKNLARQLRFSLEPSTQDLLRQFTFESLWGLCQRSVAKTDVRNLSSESESEVDAAKYATRHVLPLNNAMQKLVLMQLCMSLCVTQDKLSNNFSLFALS